jgi:hypothetical protein
MQGIILITDLKHARKLAQADKSAADMMTEAFSAIFFDNQR